MTYLEEIQLVPPSFHITSSHIPIPPPVIELADGWPTAPLFVDGLDEGNEALGNGAII